jgi:hypothetical protein
MVSLLVPALMLAQDQTAQSPLQKSETVGVRSSTPAESAVNQDSTQPVTANETQPSAAPASVQSPETGSDGSSITQAPVSQPVCQPGTLSLTAASACSAVSTPYIQPFTLLPSSKKKSGIHWGPLLAQWWEQIAFQHGVRLTLEAKTRAELNGRYFHDWFSVVENYRYTVWNDGDKFFTSNIAHPAQGALVEAIFWHNDDHVKMLDQDFHNPQYRKGLLEAFLFATVDAVQWKLGPVSEATIGHVGLPTRYQGERNRTGLNDLVMNEAGGTAMTIGLQWVDKHLTRRFERGGHNRALVDTLRIFANPPQGLSNLFAWQSPWHRDNRD